MGGRGPGGGMLPRRKRAVPANKPVTLQSESRAAQRAANENASAKHAAAGLQLGKVVEIVPGLQLYLTEGSVANDVDVDVFLTTCRIPPSITHVVFISPTPNHAGYTSQSTIDGGAVVLSLAIPAECNAPCVTAHQIHAASDFIVCARQAQSATGDVCDVSERHLLSNSNNQILIIAPPARMPCAVLISAAAYIAVGDVNVARGVSEVKQRLSTHYGDGACNSTDDGDLVRLLEEAGPSSSGV